MAYDDVITRNENEELAVRVVSATEQSTVVNPNDVYTRDTDGNLAVRVVGQGGGDSHNKGYFATPQALQEAYPTAEDGDYAIVGSTDTVWVWDSDTGTDGAWKDTDTKGQVTSVNNQTGDVVVQETLVSGTNIKTVDGNSLLGSGNLELSTYLPFPASWTTDSTTLALCGDIANDTNAVKGKAYLGEITCNDLPASLVNGEIVVEIMDGTTAQDKIIILTLSSGTTAPYMWKYTYWNGGSNVSGWIGFQQQLVSGTNIKTINGNSVLGSGNIATEVIQYSTLPEATAEYVNKPVQYIGTSIQYSYQSGHFYHTKSEPWSNLTITQSSGISLSDLTINPDIYLDGAEEWTFTDYLMFNGSAWGYYDPEDPESYSPETYTEDLYVNYGISFTGTPVANDIIQIVGVETIHYVWNEMYIGVPDIENNSDKFLKTNGYYLFWTKALENRATGTNSIGISTSSLSASAPDSFVAGVINYTNSTGGSVVICPKNTYSQTNTGSGIVAIGNSASCHGTDGVAIGNYAKANLSKTIGIGSNSYANGTYSVALGAGASTSYGADYAIQLGAGYIGNVVTNNTARTMCVCFGGDNYMLLDQNGEIPHDRLKKVATIPATAPVLASADWSNNSQTITVSGVTANNVVIVSPAPASASDYASAGILCTAQATNSLTFTCDSVPSNDITLSIVILG